MGLFTALDSLADGVGAYSAIGKVARTFFRHNFCCCLAIVVYYEWLRSHEISTWGAPMLLAHFRSSTSWKMQPFAFSFSTALSSIPATIISTTTRRLPSRCRSRSPRQPGLLIVGECLVLVNVNVRCMLRLFTSVPPQSACLSESGQRRRGCETAA